MWSPKRFFSAYWEYLIDVLLVAIISHFERELVGRRDRTGYKTNNQIMAIRPGVASAVMEPTEGLIFGVVNLHSTRVVAWTGPKSGKEAET